jgi:hypothetical protein
MKSIWILVCLLLLLSLSVYAQEFNITIDAEKDAYYNTLTGPADGWLWIPHEAFNNNGDEPLDDIDLSANYYSAWDETYLYIYEEVNDDIVNQTNGTNYWANDCIDGKIDPDPSSALSGEVFCFALTCMDSLDVDPGMWGGIGDIVETVGGGWVQGVDSSAIKSVTKDDYARKLTDTGYVLELRIKWAWVVTSGKGPIIPAVGDMYGFAVMNHDNDLGTGRDGSIEWAAAMLDNVWSNCNNHGYIELLADHKINYVAQSLRDPTIVNPNPDMYVPPEVVAVSQQSAVVKNFALLQNYPNPFNPSTRIEFSVPKSTFVMVKVFNLLGEEVATLASREFNAGRYTVDWNASSAPSGVYFYRLTAGSFVDTKKMMLMK